MLKSYVYVDGWTVGRKSPGDPILSTCGASKGNIPPIDPTGLLPVDDEDCPDVGGEGGDQDGEVGDGEREGDAVHDDRLLAHQPEA